eukprot:scaffold48051_cov43-Cyclotella_meneghiniana.AAC.1
MKLSIPATAFATLLSGKPVLSKSDTILYTEAATKTDSEIKMELQKSLLEQKKMLLKTFHDKAQEAYLATPAKTCDPTTTANHGILVCPANQVCIGDPTSLLGGVCTEAVHKTVNTVGVKGAETESDSSAGYVDGSKTIFGGNSYDEVYEMNEPNEHVDGSVGSSYGENAIEMFEGDANNGEKGVVDVIKYGDTGGNNVRIKSDAGLLDGGVRSNNGEEVNMISDEDGVSDSKMVDHVRLKVEQKYLQLREMMKSKSSLKKLMLQGGSVVTTKKECTPTSASPDTGILNCPINQVCIQDSASMLGGVCVKVVHGNASLAQDKVAEAQPGGKALKPLAVKDKLNAELILKGSRAGLEEYLPSVSGECSPGTNDGFVDLGILNGCDVGHVCVRDPHANVGGTCVNIGGTSDTSRISRDLFEGGKHRHLLTCDYLNGTSGEKCSGMLACGDLSSDFIANNIGCGSCNAFGACRSLTSATSTMHVLTAKDIFTSMIIHATECTRAWDLGCFSSCCGIGNSTIGKESCNKGELIYECSHYLCLIYTLNASNLTTVVDGACKDLSGNTTIGFNSCNDCYSCESTSGTTTITDQSCNELKACSETSGNTTIANQSCNAQYSCSYGSYSRSIIETTDIGKGSCNKARACSNAEGAYAFFWHNCCNGEGACEGATSANLVVLQDSCNMKDACRGSS